MANDPTTDTALNPFFGTDLDRAKDVLDWLWDHRDDVMDLANRLPRILEAAGQSMSSAGDGATSAASLLIGTNDTPGAANNAANLAYRRAMQCATSLPIELISLGARNDGPAVLLEWSTASETDNQYFTIERSTDGLSYSALLSTPGAGTSQTAIDYKAHDAEPVVGVSYYRLRQTDFDGSSAVSDAVAVHRRTASNAVHAFMQADGTVVLEHPCSAANWRICDMLGRELAAGRTGEGPYTVLDLSSGTHRVIVLSVICNNEVASFPLVR